MQLDSMHLENFRFSFELRKFLEAHFLYYNHWQDVQALASVITEGIATTLELTRSLKVPGSDASVDAYTFCGELQ